MAVMPRNLPSFTFTGCFVVLLGVISCSAGATDVVVRSAVAEPIELELDSGRRFIGLIGNRSDQLNLHLRIGNASMWIGQPIPWTRIRSATMAGKSITIQQLRAKAERVTGLSESDLVPLPPHEDQVSVSNRPGTSTALEDSQPVHVVVPPASEPDQSSAVAVISHQNVFRNHGLTNARPRRVHAINIDATIANWDADVEPDGVIIHIRPLDQHGVIIPARGKLNVLLAGTRRGRRSFHASQQSEANDVTAIGRWTRQIHIQDIGPQGSFVKLPFAATHPGFDSNLGSFGLVHARFAVTGVGVFEDARDNVVLRTPGVTRDAIERGTGQRFLPFEQTGRGTRPGPSTYSSILP